MKKKGKHWHQQMGLRHDYDGGEETEVNDHENGFAGPKRSYTAKSLAMGDAMEAKKKAAQERLEKAKNALQNRMNSVQEKASKVD